MATIELSNVRKVYAGGVEAIKGVDLSIDAGQMVVLVGPSGCGKSTLLRMIAGLETITEGTVSIAGREVNRLEPAERDIAMVFQNYALYPHMTVRQNMAYGLKNRGKSKDEIETRVAEASRILQIGDYLDRKPRQLSGGQRQRVAMGRAIVREPKAFLFDEPLSNLDAKLRVEMRGEIKQLQRRLGTTSVYVTHDQLEAMTLADKLVVLNGGRVEQIGAPLEVYRNPASTFVASFIGSPAMNLVPAISDGHTLKLGDVVLDAGERQLPAGEVTVGMRAEDLKLKTVNGAPSLPLTISYVEELGAEQLVHGTHGDARIIVAVPADHRLDDVMDLTIEPRYLHLFDPQNGRRL